MAKINKLILRQEIFKTIRKSKDIEEKAFLTAESVVKEAKGEMIQEFENHLVTQEIKAGSESENISSTLGGYGNLYSFIGFEEGHDPTETVREYLEKSANLRRNSRFVRNQEGGAYLYQVNPPSMAEAEAVAPSPWEGKSWLRGVERGISGLGYYLYLKFKDLENSRSGKGLQVIPKVRDLAFKPVKYLSDIINNFNRKIK